MGQPTAFNHAQIAKGKLSIDAVVAAIKAGVDSAADQIGNDLEVAMRILISPPIFPRSAPGAPPHRDSGELSGLGPSFAATHSGSGPGYQADVDKGGDTVTIAFGSSAGHAQFLEEGTSKMAARPHLGRVVGLISPTIPTIVIAHIEGRVATAAAALPR